VNRVAVVLAALALLVSLTASAGPALADFVFANNSDKVDGKHAVGAGASIHNRRGKLVATNAANGRLPNNIIVKAPNADKLDGKDSQAFLALAAPAGRLVAEGRVTSAGFLLGAAGAGVTASRTGNGSYSVGVPGLQPGCTGSSPNLVATPFGGAEVGVGIISTTCATGDVTFAVNTRNSAGASTDGDFFFVIFSGNPVTKSPSSRVAKSHPSVCVVTPAGQTCH
jgi:hypothetical protein